MFLSGVHNSIIAKCYVPSSYSNTGDISASNEITKSLNGWFERKKIHTRNITNDSWLSDAVFYSRYDGDMQAGVLIQIIKKNGALIGIFRIAENNHLQTFTSEEERQELLLKEYT